MSLPHFKILTLHTVTLTLTFIILALRTHPHTSSHTLTDTITVHTVLMTFPGTRTLSPPSLTTPASRSPSLTTTSKRASCWLHMYADHGRETLTNINLLTGCTTECSLELELGHSKSMVMSELGYTIALFGTALHERLRKQASWPVGPPFLVLNIFSLSGQW